MHQNKPIGSLFKYKPDSESWVAIRHPGLIELWLKECAARAKKVLPIWLSVLLMTLGIQISAALVFQPKPNLVSSAYAVPDKPTVLGESISLRGPDVQPVKPIQPQKTGALELKDITAKSFLAYDQASGAILAEKDVTRRLPIASLTKLMTALVAYDSIDLNQYLTVTEKDQLDVSPALNLKTGDKIQGWDLFNSMLVGSANDAAQALGDFTSQNSAKDFVGLMNDKAKKLSMIDSHFSNPVGFDSKYNYSTAQDLKKLVDRTQSLVAFTSLGKKTSYSFSSVIGNPYRVAATNKLVGAVSGVEAIKTGFTNNAGGAMITKITKNGHQVILIVISSQDREKDTLRLSDQIFGAYQW